MADQSTDGLEERLLTGYTGRLLIAISIGWGSIQAGRLLIGPLLPEITADLGLSDTRAGLAITALWGLYALLQYPSGRLSDQLSRKTLLVGGLLSLSLGFAALASAGTYLSFVGGCLIIGFGAGLYPTPARGLVSDLFVSRRGQAFGIHTASGDIGGVIAAGLATVVLAVAIWRTAFAPVILVLLGVALALHLWGREPYTVNTVDLAIRSTGTRLFREPKLRWLLVAYGLFAFTWQASAAFLPTFLLSKGFSVGVSNAGFGLLFVIGAVVKPVAGGLGDRFPRALMAPVAVALAAIMLLAVIAAGQGLVALVAIAGFATGLMAFPPVMQAYLMDSFPTDTMAGDLGAMRTLYIGFGALGPTYVGFTADSLDYVAAFGGLVLCLVASSLIILMVGRR